MNETCQHILKNGKLCKNKPKEGELCGIHIKMLKAKRCVCMPFSGHGICGRGICGATVPSEKGYDIYCKKHHLANQKDLTNTVPVRYNHCERSHVLCNV